ncbi:hypothetical protein EYF80_039304 [Liparis tanakae]|uniref:Uncharacterized protein n=1 Tax=Liparis tanakae TaxID=230148 RepID=A0A4Z2GCR3_9TELE|nr:hypothetical protein EYF80_039304 [Liparis tanakae]
MGLSAPPPTDSVRSEVEQQHRGPLTSPGPVGRAGAQLQDVLPGQAEFALQELLLALQRRHAGLQLLGGVLHVPLPHAAGAGLTETHQPGGHPESRERRSNEQRHGTRLHREDAPPPPKCPTSDLMSPTSLTGRSAAVSSIPGDFSAPLGSFQTPQE